MFHHHRRLVALIVQTLINYTPKHTNYLHLGHRSVDRTFIYISNLIVISRWRTFNTRAFHCADRDFLFPHEVLFGQYQLMFRDIFLCSSRENQGNWAIRFAQISQHIYECFALWNLTFGFTIGFTLFIATQLVMWKITRFRNQFYNINNKVYNFLDQYQFNEYISELY